MDHQWYRRTDWNDQAEAEFFRRLKRARSQRPEYLSIQAWTLVSTGRVDSAATALNLLEIFFQDYSESCPLSAARALHTKAQALIVLERWEEAFQAFEDGLTLGQSMPNVVHYGGLDYPLAIARRRARARYPRALELLE